MSNGAGSGDRLARGAHRAQFMTTEGGVSQDKWSQAFDDFDPEEFKKKAEQEQQVTASGEGLQIVSKETVEKAIEYLGTAEGAVEFKTAFNDSVNDPAHLQK